MKIRIYECETFLHGQEDMYKIDIQLLEEIPFGTYGFLDKESANKFAANLKKYKKTSGNIVTSSVSFDCFHYEIGNYCVLDARLLDNKCFILSFTYFGKKINPHCEYTRDELDSLINLLAKTHNPEEYSICGEYEILND